MCFLPLPNMIGYHYPTLWFFLYCVGRKEKLIGAVFSKFSRKRIGSQTAGPCVSSTWWDLEQRKGILKRSSLKGIYILRLRIISPIAWEKDKRKLTFRLSQNDSSTKITIQSLLSKLLLSWWKFYKCLNCKKTLISFFVILSEDPFPNCMFCQISTNSEKR